MGDSKIPSEEFTRALKLVSCGGGSQATCELCGRYHFASAAGYDFLDGELARLDAQAQEKPDQFIDHLADSVSWAYLSGRQVVVGCPCGEARKWEKFIVDHRELITHYLPLRLKRIEGERELELKSEREMVARLAKDAKHAAPAIPQSEDE